MNNEYLIMNNTKKNPSSYENGFSLVGEGGFEPPKSLTTDLQSVPFGHSGTHPYKNKMELVDGLEPPTC